MKGKKWGPENGLWGAIGLSLVERPGSLRRSGSESLGGSTGTEGPHSTTGTSLPGASVGISFLAKVMRKEAQHYTKVRSSLRRPPVPERLPPKPECLLYCFMLSPIPLTLRGAVPPPPLSEKELTCSSS